MKAFTAEMTTCANWFEHMRCGDFASAWQISQRVLEAGINRPSVHVPRHHQAIWDGTPLAGKCVLVRCYHGLGDTIQFIRYLPMVKAIAGQTIVWAQPSLIPLLTTADGIDQLLPLHDGIPDCAYDVDVEVMELPLVFRTTIDTIPARVPYLHVPRRPALLGERMAVGLVWCGGDWDNRRWIPFDLLHCLRDIDGVCLYILQRDAKRAGWKPGFGDLVASQSTLEDAQLIQSLDLVITVDTMVAHLAGALGVPVWTLLPEPADWRWMNDRADTPWYPTMRLFRQKVPGRWEDVVEEIACTLRQFAVEQQRGQVA